MLFTENETNQERLFQQKSRTPYVKDAFHRYLVNGERTAVNPAMKGTKAAAHFASEIAPGKSWTIRCRLMERILPQETHLQKIFSVLRSKLCLISGKKKRMNSTRNAPVPG